MKKNIILFDGPHGMPLWEKAEKNGIAKAPVWRYNIEHPELVAELEKEYIAAGAQIVLANTFSANGPAVKKASPYTTPQIVEAGVKLTKGLLAGTGITTGLAIGPMSELLEPYGDLEEDECEAVYEEMIGTGMDAGAEMIYLQTFMDIEMMKIAAKIALSYRVPVHCSFTFQSNGRTLMGNTPTDIVRAFEPLAPAAIGVNCALGPDQMLPIVREYASVTQLPIVVKANSGRSVYDGGTGIGSDPVSYAEACEPLLEYVSYIGGCCGCDPRYIVELKKKLS